MKLSQLLIKGPIPEMRIDQLTFTRFIACLCIVIFHFGTGIFPFSHAVISPLLKSSFVGVSYFYILSGFVIVIAYQKRTPGTLSARTFFKNRLARLYPVYLMALLLTLLYYIVSKRVIKGMDVLLQVTLLQAWIPTHPMNLNTPAWSVSVEILFYSLFPFLHNRIYHRFSFRNIAVFILILWIVTQLLMNILLHSVFYKGDPSFSHDFLFYFPLMHLNEFLIGNLTGLLFLKNNTHKASEKMDLLIIVLLLILSISLNYAETRIFHDGLLAILFAPLIYIFSRNTGFFTRVCKQNWALQLGELSYGLYIYQKPMFLLGNKYLPMAGIHNTTTTFYVNLFFLMIISLLSLRFFEEPLRLKIRSIGTKNEVAQSFPKP